ncbi:hypothetical protein FGO68_gene12135 [Halteria grandinella]|uniref:Uncharacterized protein n=1 Tax=Halteria grandinella TaxID=5974 RepID=A0A8J8T9V6_HALGN|nr:hypothetical protein FGO68_gene12135 [Halteria grandinella]
MFQLLNIVYKHFSPELKSVVNIQYESRQKYIKTSLKYNYSSSKVSPWKFCLYKPRIMQQENQNGVIVNWSQGGKNIIHLYALH